MIEVEQLAKRFVQGRGKKAREVRAVDNVSWRAEDGRITGLLGPNGAGKTTTLRMVATLIAPDAGRILVDGIDVAAEPMKALSRMGVLSDARGLYPRLTARENIVYYGRLHGMSDQQASARADHLAHVLEMMPLLDRRTDGFSQGEKMKTALARALVHNPPKHHPGRADQRARRAGPPARCAKRCAGCATARASASCSRRTSCRRSSGCVIT